MPGEFLFFLVYDNPKFGRCLVDRCQLKPIDSASIRHTMKRGKPRIRQCGFVQVDEKGVGL